MLLRNLPDLFLGVISNRHQRMCQLALRQVIKGIRLILACRYGVTDRISSIVKDFHTGIVPGCNVVCSDFQGTLKERLPFHIAVTGNAGIRCPAMQILLHEIVNHLLLKFLTEIHDIVRNVQYLCNPSCIINGS